MVSSFQVALATMLLVGGIIVLLAARRGLLPEFSRNGVAIDLVPLRLVLAAAGAVLVYALTQWPVAAFYAALAGALGPSQWLARRKRRAAIARVESIASWVETLRDTMAASAGLQEALRLSASVAPAPIKTEVGALAVRLQHQSVPQALRRFAGDMRHPLADQVVASIILASLRSAGSLRPILAMTSAAARDTASMWREVESARSNAFAQARLASIISLTLMFFMVTTNREFLRPFDSFGGQIALFIVLGAFLGSGVALYRMAQQAPPERIFEGIESWSYGELGSPAQNDLRVR